MEYILKTPVSKTDIAPLRAGDTVKLSGVVYTARDAAHKRLVELVDRGEPLPFELPGSAIYYVGPTRSAPERSSAPPGPPPPAEWTPTRPGSSRWASPS
jgi:fumarate hydratase subunit beta